MQPIRVTYAPTEICADSFYLARTRVTDAFAAFECEGRRTGVFSSLEFNRMQEESAFDAILHLEDCLARTKKAYGVDSPLPGDMIALLVREMGAEGVLVGEDFPALILRQMEARGLRVDVAEGMLFAERRVKSDREADWIREGNAAACAGFDTVRDMLGRADVAADGSLVLDSTPLTSERVKVEIAVACLRMGGIATGTIVAGGDQACNPHGEGRGVLRAGELIVVDIFPRMCRSGYHGDMTRTYIKGAPTSEQRRLHDTVAEAQKLALSRMKAGVDGRALHFEITDFFTSLGYPTELREGRFIGFFHGLGHSLGLEIHELPRMNRSGTMLFRGAAITVEPGLYYRGLGGCRIEDVVRVTDGGVEMLSNYTHEWIIP
jgi:Xaa-Pro aminopeptidase